MTNQQIEATIKACYSTWSDTYYNDYYGDGAAYPPVHRDLLKRLLREAAITNLLDAGCGPASFLRDLAEENLELYGFDLTPEMVTEGKRVFESLGFSADRIWEGSVLEADAYRAPAEHPESGFDAAVCCGVLPHIAAESDTTVIERLHDCVKPGGLVVAEARNELFALFTLNRYSHDFFVDRLVQANQLVANANGTTAKLVQTLDELKNQFRMDLPPVRQGKEDEPGYDEVLSRTHNPFVLKQQFIDRGFQDVEVLFYHYHALPPMFEAAMPEFFRQQSLAMEDPRDWRGHFMASAFFVTGRRA